MTHHRGTESTEKHELTMTQARIDHIGNCTNRLLRHSDLVIAVIILLCVHCVSVVNSL